MSPSFTPLTCALAAVLLLVLLCGGASAQECADSLPGSWVCTPGSLDSEWEPSQLYTFASDTGRVEKHDATIDDFGVVTSGCVNGGFYEYSASGISLTYQNNQCHCNDDDDECAAVFAGATELTDSIGDLLWSDTCQSFAGEQASGEAIRCSFWHPNTDSSPVSFKSSSLLSTTSGASALALSAVLAAALVVLLF